MKEKIDVKDREWENPENQYKYGLELEKGNLLFFQKIPFDFSKENIGLQNETSKKLSLLFPSYSRGWKVGPLSFSKKEEPFLHFSADKARPVHGVRTLQCFFNFDSKETARFTTSFSFEELLHQFGGKEVPFPKGIEHTFKSLMERKLKLSLAKLGIGVSLRSPYDQFMLKMNRFLEKNTSFQKSAPKKSWEFPPMSCWMMFTDQTSYARAREQTVASQLFFVPLYSLFYPEDSPVNFLTRVMNQNLVDAAYLKHYLTT